MIKETNNLLFNLSKMWYNQHRIKEVKKLRKVLKEDLLIKMNYYFMATNYLSVAQLYLMDNVLLKRPLKKEDIKPKVVGHWGTAPGQNFIYVHLNRLIKEHNLNMIYISGPGHGGQAMIANAYLEGTYSEVYPNITQDEEGLKKLCKQFSFPGGVSSHVAPETPGSINEGGELGYSLAHAYGAILDNKDLIAACVIGDGEAETGPLQASFHINKFINPKTDGIVLPILHVNGYKISNPTIFGRMTNKQIKDYFNGCNYKAYIVEAKNLKDMHNLMANSLEWALKDIQKLKQGQKIPFPIIIMKSPKGWTGPKEVNLKRIEGTFRAHQVPINITNENDIKLLEKWLKSYHPEKLFDENGTLVDPLRQLPPKNEQRMSANPITNGGLLLKELNTPSIKNYEVKITQPGKIEKQDMMELSKYIKDVFALNKENKNFRCFGPDEALSNRLNHIFDEVKRMWNTDIKKYDEFLSKQGRVMDSLLSEHVCQGMLEGYLLTGRHGFIHSYEAFIRIVDSMASQHAKWLKVTKEIPWRQPIASLNYILTSHTWQQDHNGYTHQDPGFLNHLVTKKSDIVRMYLPFDANTLISTFDHCIKTKNYINVIVASKHPRPQYLTMNEAIKHCEQGIGELEFISDKTTSPKIIFACCGDTPTLEVIAATKILRELSPETKIRVINIIDLMRLETKEQHPHGMTNKQYDKLFTKTKPIIFAFHGYPNLIHQLTYKRTNQNLHVHGYLEEGTITTPFDMRVQNKIDRYHLILDALKYANIKNKENIEDYCNQMLEKHHRYIRQYGKDIPEVENFKLN